MVAVAHLRHTGRGFGRTIFCPVRMLFRFTTVRTTKFVSFTTVYHWTTVKAAKGGGTTAPSVVRTTRNLKDFFLLRDMQNDDFIKLRPRFLKGFQHNYGSEIF